MGDESTASEKWSFWSASQRRAVRLILGGILALWGYRFVRDRAIISYPQRGAGQRADELEDQLDPNTASAADLAALPVIGPSVARQIVSYRDQFHAEHRGNIAFKSSDDLLKVKGLGFNTLQQVKPYLKFPISKSPGAHSVLK